MYCPNCGAECKETTWNRIYCPNCGIVGGEETESDTDTPNYVG